MLTNTARNMQILGLSNYMLHEFYCWRPFIVTVPEGKLDFVTIPTQEVALEQASG